MWKQHIEAEIFEVGYSAAKHNVHFKERRTNLQELQFSLSCLYWAGNPCLSVIAVFIKIPARPHQSSLNPHH